MIDKTIYLTFLEDLNKDGKILYREASRAIIMKENLILLVYSKVNKDYKFPGGGIEKNESKTDAMIREVLEEVGGIITKVKSQFARITTINADTINKDYDIFQMVSHYFFCEIDDILVAQELSKYESELSFVPKWITVEEAIKANENVLKSKNIPAWTFRETEVLKLIKNMGLALK